MTSSRRLFGRRSVWFVSCNNLKIESSFVSVLGSALRVAALSPFLTPQKPTQIKRAQTHPFRSIILSCKSTYPYCTRTPEREREERGTKAFCRHIRTCFSSL
ncbi:hypothetical protein K1719_026542 [Acacia pycnantha]|nr:hypothetical protein K1719_026542 [Acacia pycnantha]